MTILSVFGGSGVYDIAGLENPAWMRVKSPFGETSDEFLFGTLDGLKVVFVPRHGRGHRHSPSSINYRANIDALKRCGVTDLLSVSARGSLREDLQPGQFVIVDQFVDRTIARENSFLEMGWSRMSRWRIRPAIDLRTLRINAPPKRLSRSGAAAPISQWKDRSFPA